MASDLTFYDAAYPPADPPVTDGVVIYIGGDTPHVWTLPEIRAQRARYRLPMFVRSDPQAASPQIDVLATVRQLREIGAPTGCLVGWDSETSADAVYIRQVFALLKAARYVLIDYGSQSSVFGNDNPDGYYFGADWTDRPGIQPGDVITQWESRAAYDLSSGEKGLPYWDTQTGGSPPPPADWTAKMIGNLPTVQQGMSDRVNGVNIIHRAQALCAVIGDTDGVGPARGLSSDGVFGPSTKAAVEAVQALFGLAQDGIVGPDTWTALVAGSRA